MTSFDHLVGAGEHSGWNVEAERLCGLGVDDQLEPTRLHDRQVRRLGALEDATGIDADLRRVILCISHSSKFLQGCTNWAGAWATSTATA
jgi:hypothetical protein